MVIQPRVFLVYWYRKDNPDDKRPIPCGLYSTEPRVWFEDPSAEFEDEFSDDHNYGYEVVEYSLFCGARGKADGETEKEK